jgi:antitoxin FitA
LPLRFDHLGRSTKPSSAALPPKLSTQLGKSLSLIACHLKELSVANLLVRGVDESIVMALKERAGAHGRSAEAEHRLILAQALARPRKRSFAQVLAAMPDVGLDADFERVNLSTEASRVFD